MMGMLRLDWWCKGLFSNLLIAIYSEFREAYKPTEVFNPTYQRMWQCISYRAINQDTKELPPMDPRFVAGVLPLPELVEKSKPHLESLKEAFAITKGEVSLFFYGR
jgi:hypothetical protein